MMSMQDYANSIEDVVNFRKTVTRYEPLSNTEMKLYRKMTEKISILAQTTRPDLYFTRLDMGRNAMSVNIYNSRQINTVLKMVREREQGTLQLD